ncbi:MAG: divergent PAP2 family protein [Oscillospiraceae bacterium]
MIKAIFFHNYLLMLAVFGWLSAQILKTIVQFVVSGRFSGERLIGAGGWPSSHSALVCSLLMGVARKEGLSSPLFALSFVLAVVVMYDAMGVRRETGKQAKVINQLMDELSSDDDEGQQEETKKLKEMVGHTPFQVLSGALLGILLAVIIPVF